MLFTCTCTAVKYTCTVHKYHICNDIQLCIYMYMHTNIHIIHMYRHVLWTGRLAASVIEAGVVTHWEAVCVDVCACVCVDVCGCVCGCVCMCVWMYNVPMYVACVHVCVHRCVQNHDNF